MKLGDMLAAAMRAKDPTLDQDFALRQWVYGQGKGRGCRHVLTGFTRFEKCPFCHGLKGVAG